jgi:glycyl-tRNA synthetase alpha chain
VWLDGMELTQFTYFQQAGSIDLHPISVELTYGLERIAMYLQRVHNVYDLAWNSDVSYCDVHHKGEWENSTYNFEVADTAMLFKLFDLYEAESRNAVDKGLVLPAYDYCLKCSHAFNLLEARGAISVTQRTAFIARVRGMARAVAEAYTAQREQMGHPLLKGKEAA